MRLKRHWNIWGMQMSFKSGYVAILGAPNAGKSTLLNYLLKEKIAAVSSKPQTTRKNLVGIYTTDQVQIIFLDTPGIHQSHKKLNEFMGTQVQQALVEADILCFLFAINEPLSGEGLKLLKRARQKFKAKKIIIIVNKIDLSQKLKEFTVEEIKGYLDSEFLYYISAKTGEGVDIFLDGIKDLLPEGPAYYPEDQITDKNLREIVGEIIREKVFELMYQEIPYSLVVKVNLFKEQQDLTHIQANLIVETESQKGMVIGKGGKMIKEIGVRARQAIEPLVQTKVFLELRVKVDKKWTQNPIKLANYGYK